MGATNTDKIVMLSEEGKRWKIVYEDAEKGRVVLHSYEPLDVRNFIDHLYRRIQRSRGVE